MLILAHERNTHAARMKLEDHIGIGGANLRHLCRIISLVELGVDFTDNFALEPALEARQRILARLIVRGKNEGALEAFLFRSNARCLVERVILP